MLSRKSILSWILVFGYLSSLKFAVPRVPKKEVDALQEIVTAMGATMWKFNADACEMEMVGVTQTAPSGSVGNVKCECTSTNHTVCHVTKIVLKSYNLPGVLPPAIVKLPYLREIDFAYNLLSGTIPAEWASTKLNSISLLVNRLSGELPKELGNITTLTYLNLEANQFSGSIPSELGKLINLKTLILSSNRMTRNLPISFSRLIHLEDLRINDNNLSGPIPDFIQKWEQLTHLEMHTSGLEGPIPSNISHLNMLMAVGISDIKGPTQGFPVLRSMTGLSTLVLRNCNISGEIPAYIWKIRTLKTLDVSFNKLVGNIPDDPARNLKVVIVSGNMLSGNIPDALLDDGSNIDLSYNNFEWKGPDQLACRSNMNQNVNLFKSSTALNPIQRMLPCTRNVHCPRYKCSLFVNCGGGNLEIEESNGKGTFEGDATGGDSSRFSSSSSFWGFSSTGEFIDHPSNQNSRSIRTASKTNLSDLYSTARLSPLSLTYYHYCLENGSYSVKLHFAEILFTNDNTYSSLGKRMFDIYIQDKLVLKDFNIEDEARGVQRPVTKHFNTTVSDNTLEIRFYWASKGTIRIPNRGDYGSLISAIAVTPNFKICSSEGKNKRKEYVSVGVVATCLTIFLVCGFLWWKYCSKRRKQKDLEGSELHTVSFTLKQIKAATNNFSPANKIGEGGFGPVYKGQLSDGTVIAVKQLSSRSRQGNREFLNEIGMISFLQHPNLVKLHGCCIEEDQLLLVYEYMENNSLACVLFGSEKSQLMLDWPTRFKICLGIARGLEFLHEESRLKIVHRDIKATNVLLDRDINPKISDFGLARLSEDEKTHISTRVAGTIGYMAPEYALWGYLTDKADVYSFGIMVLEIISGKSNSKYMPNSNFTCLLEMASHLQGTSNIDELLDQRLGSQVNREEVERMVKVAILCTNATSSFRPAMSEVVQMLEGQVVIPDVPLKAEGNDARFKTIKSLIREMQYPSSSETQTLKYTSIETVSASSTESSNPSLNP